MNTWYKWCCHVKEASWRSSLHILKLANTTSQGGFDSGCLHPSPHLFRRKYHLYLHLHQINKHLIFQIEEQTSSEENYKIWNERHYYGWTHLEVKTIWRSTSAWGQHLEVNLIWKSKQSGGQYHLEVNIIWRSISSGGPHLGPNIIWRSTSSGGQPHLQFNIIWRSTSGGQHHLCINIWRLTSVYQQLCINIWRTTSGG